MDSTQKIVSDFMNNNDIKSRLINVENGGVSKARNIGLKCAKTPWVSLCDSDDVWLPQKLEIQSSLINQNEDIDFLGGNHTDKVQYFLFSPIERLKRLSCKDLCIKVLPQTSTAIFKKKIFDEIGGYDENQKYAEDGDFFMKIAANYNYFYSPEQVVYYGNGKRGFGESGLSANIAKMHEGILKNYKEMLKLKYINMPYYLFSVAFEYCKYCRRLLVNKCKKK